MTGELDPLDGMVKRHNHLKIGMYHQHLADALPMDMNPLEYFVSPLPPPPQAALLVGRSGPLS